MLGILRDISRLRIDQGTGLRYCGAIVNGGHMSTKNNSNEFEQSLSELEQLVESMETGELSLEDSLNAFEKGVKLTRDCQTKLNAAEQKVELLMEKQGELVSQPFEPET